MTARRAHPGAVLPHPRQPVPRRATPSCATRTAGCSSATGASRRAATIATSAPGASRGARARLARRLRAARLRRHARALSPAAHHRRPGPVAARLARARRRCPKKRAWPTSPTPPSTAERVRPARSPRTARRRRWSSARTSARPRRRSSRPPTRAGLRIDQRAGRVGSRPCGPSCTSRPRDAYRDSTELIRRFHGRGRLLYAVTPRFALSASEAMLEVCQTLLGRARRAARADAHQRERRTRSPRCRGCFRGRTTIWRSTSATA